MSDWADEIEAMAKAAHDRQEGERNEDSGVLIVQWIDLHHTAQDYWREFVKPILPILRKAKADGLREAAEHYENTFPYVDRPLGALFSPFAGALYNRAKEIESPTN